jgi:hypothetical protein
MAYLLSNSTFIHIPKTGGQWVTLALKRAGLIQASIGVVHSSPDELLHESEYRVRPSSFAIVRHPLSWYSSMWAHRLDDQWDPIDDVEWFSKRWIDEWALFTEACRADSFSDFLTRAVEHYPHGWVSMLYDTYTEGCTHVGRQEQLPSDLLAILTAVGEVFGADEIISTPDRNVRGRKHRRILGTEISRSLVTEVMRVEQQAVSRFDYAELPSWIAPA